MKPNLTLLKRVDARLAAGAAVVAATLTGPALPNADAQIVYSGPVNINIPSNGIGVYLNVVTGVNNPNPSLVPGWDINPYGTASFILFNPSTPAGGVYVVNAPGGTSATAPDNLANLGAYLISAASGFGSGTVEATGLTSLNLNSSNNIIGFRFQNEATGIINYGWFRVSLAGTSGAQPRAIVEYAYDSTGVGILAGAIPEPTTFALLGMMAVGAIGVREWRKRKAA